MENTSSSNVRYNLLREMKTLHRFGKPKDAYGQRIRNKGKHQAKCRPSFPRPEEPNEGTRQSNQRCKESNLKHESCICHWSNVLSDLDQKELG